MSALLASACAALIALLAVQPARGTRITEALGIRRANHPPLTPRAILERVPGSRWSRAAHESRQARAIDALSALVAELHVGTPARDALARAVAGIPDVCPRTLAAARCGGDVVVGIREDARSVPALRGLAAVWQVGEESGAGLARATAALVHGLRESEETRRTLESQMAGPRASARMLSLLPVIGLLMGMLLGGNPLEWLLGSTPGRMCLVGGVALNVAGVAWMSRIAVRARVAT